MPNNHEYRYHLNNAYLDSPLEFGNILLRQVGRLYCHSSTVIETHTHSDLFELTVITAGKGTVYTDGIPCEVRAGDIYFSFPHEDHCIISDEKDPLQYDFFAFSTTDAELQKQLDRIVAEYASAFERVFSDNSLTLLVAGAIFEMRLGDNFSHTMLTHICEQIVIRTIREFSQKNKDSKSKKELEGSEAQIICYRAMSYIDNHITSIKSLTEISEAMNYNYSYLSYLFKKTTGTALTDYYRRRRLEESKRLLRENSKSISTIAEILNYSSLYTFSRAFKAEYGISPNQFKREPNKDK